MWTVLYLQLVLMELMHRRDDLAPLRATDVGSKGCGSCGGWRRGNEHMQGKGQLPPSAAHRRPHSGSCILKKVQNLGIPFGEMFRRILGRKGLTHVQDADGTIFDKCSCLQVGILFFLLEDFFPYSCKLV